MRKILLVTALAALSASAFSQENTFGRTGEIKKEELPAKKLLIIPFQESMYKSAEDKALAQEMRISPALMRKRFRHELTGKLYEKCQGKMSGRTLLDAPEFAEDLNYTYGSVGYKSEMAVAKPAPSATSSRPAFIQKIEERHRQATGAPQSDSTFRYMNARITNPSLLQTLGRRFGAEYFLFINEFDLSLAPGTRQEEIAYGNYNREVKVHYTIFSVDGKQVASGAEFVHFNSRQNSEQFIFNALMEKVAEKVVANL